MKHRVGRKTGSSTKSRPRALWKIIGLVRSIGQVLFEMEKIKYRIINRHDNKRK